MNKLIYLTLFASISGEAKTRLDLIMGGLTTHIVGSDKAIASKYANKVNDRGVIAPALLGFRYNTMDSVLNGYTLFIGQNSVGGHIMGFTYSRGYYWSRVELLATIGAYKQDSSDFKAVGIKPFGLFKGNLVPVLGGEVNLIVFKDKEIEIKVNNLISPIITNHNFSVGIVLN